MKRPALLALVAVTLTCLPAQAQRSIVLEEFRSEIVVRPDASIEVTETLRPRFAGSWNGLLRDISLEHRTAEGRRERLDVEVLAVTDADGEALRYELEKPDGWTRRVRMWVPGAEDTTRTLVLRYRVENALRFFDEQCEPGPVPILRWIREECRPYRLDELYWNVTGNDWEISIRRTEARIVLPDGISPTQMAVYSGRTGATTSDAEIDSAGNVVSVVYGRTLSPGEGLTVGVGWEPGVVERPGTGATLARSLWRWTPLLPLALVFAACFTLWRRRGRDPAGRPIAVAYEPPDGLTPAEVGTLVDHTVHMREITATIVDLAVKGYITIEEREESKLLGLASDTEYIFHLRRPEEEWDALPEHERKVLKGVFDGSHGEKPGLGEVFDAVREAGKAHAAGEEFDARSYLEKENSSKTAVDSVELSDLKNSFYSSLPGIRGAVYDSLIARGYYRSRPDKVKDAWIAIALGLGFLGVFATLIVHNTGFLGLSAVAVAVSWFGSALCILVFGLLMPARTTAGARAYEASLGFREFLDKVESDRYRRMITSPEMFERYLPYAMAFEVEERWAAAFEDLYRQPPEWYSGGRAGSFSTHAFAARMGALSTRASSTMSSSPSSSSSGSGGGGSSGGGSGGGGGGGF